MNWELVIDSAVRVGYGLFCYWLGYRRAFSVIREAVSR